MMEINVLEKQKDKLVFELKNTNHTFCNYLKDELRNDKDVDVASYTISHPLVGVPKFFLKAKEPTNSLNKAIKELKKKNKELQKNF